MRITVDANLRQAREGLKLLKQATQDLRPAFEDIGEMLVRSTDQRFEDQVGPDGQPWAPLSPAHLLFKQKKGYNTKILTMRGRLRASIVARPGATQVAVGTPVVYGPIQQFGGTIQQPERTLTLRHRTDAKGGLLSQAQLGIGPKRMRNAGQMLVFAKKGHKRFLERTFTSAAHEVTLPARPFLGLSSRDESELLAIIRDHLQMALVKLRA